MLSPIVIVYTYANMTEITITHSEVEALPNFEGKKIFIVEDDVFLGKVLSQRVEESKITPKRFITSEEALEALKTETPDLILLDIFLPGMNGLEALKLMRQEENSKNIPVIVVSNTDEAVHRETALGLGAKFLIKAATTPDEIIEHVFDALKKQD
jgi:CheY-like chemotaxis protein